MNGIRVINIINIFSPSLVLDGELHTSEMYANLNSLVNDHFKRMS